MSWQNRAELGRLLLWETCAWTLKQIFVMVQKYTLNNHFQTILMNLFLPKWVFPNYLIRYPNLYKYFNTKWSKLNHFSWFLLFLISSAMISHKLFISKSNLPKVHKSNKVLPGCRSTISYQIQTLDLSYQYTYYTAVIAPITIHYCDH